MITMYSIDVGALEDHLKASEKAESAASWKSWISAVKSWNQNKNSSVVVVLVYLSDSILNMHFLNVKLQGACVFCFLFDIKEPTLK